MSVSSVQVASPDEVLSLRNVTKRFRGQRALDSVDLDVRAGEVHALLGVNGSGKSTLIKILAGYHAPEPGAVAHVHGRPFSLGSAAAAAEGGLRFVHQDLGLFLSLTVAENLTLGMGHGLAIWTSEKQDRRAAASLLERFSLDIDPRTPIRQLGPAQQTMLAIVWALRGKIDARITLVLDEPTAALPEHEVQQLFDIVKQIRREGGSVLYVTHRLAEVQELCDRVTVLRDGQRVATRDVAEMTQDDLVELVIGRRLEKLEEARSVAAGSPLLVVASLAGASVRDFALTVAAGETVGIAGLVGSGYEDVAQLIFGSRRRTSGSVTVGGKQIGANSARDSIRGGIALTPSDRKRDGGMMAWTLRENVTLPRLVSGGPLRWISPRRERVDAKTWLERLEVKPADPEAMFSSLSGGNQQKVVLARWLRCDADVFIFDQPTVGVDLGARRGIYRSIAEVARRGAAVVMTSSEAEELCQVCDRVVVMRRGKVSAVLSGVDMTADRVVAESLGAAVAA
jgi:ribose transport system ATP-binding protein